MVNGAHITSFNLPNIWWSSKWFKPLLFYREIFHVMVYHCGICYLHSAMSMMMWCWYNFMLSFAYFLLYQMVMWQHSASTYISFSDSIYLVEWYYVDGVICYLHSVISMVIWLHFCKQAISYTHTLTSFAKQDKTWTFKINPKRTQHT